MSQPFRDTSSCPQSHLGHDEESRNGRDIKIDILDDYIRSSERFRVIRVFSGVPGSYENTRKKQWASWAKWWKRGGRARGPPSPNRIGLAGRPPFPSSPPSPSISFSSPSFPSPSRTWKEGGILLGVGLPPLGAPPPLGRPSPPPPFIYGGGGYPIDTS